MNAMADYLSKGKKKKKKDMLKSHELNKILVACCLVRKNYCVSLSYAKKKDMLLVLIYKIKKGEKDLIL